MERMTWKRDLDGYEDVGLRDGVTVGDAICRLASYEDAGLEPNDPLTLDQLREMDGEPVWIDDWFEDFHGWELSETASDYFEGDSRTVEAYGTRWLAYRCKPEKGAQ